jgi:hypothetical protein
MAKALFIVIQSQGRWWVDFEGRAHGPHDSLGTAAIEARTQAQFQSQMNRAAEVLVPDVHGKYWVVWDSASATQVPHAPVFRAA